MHYELSYESSVQTGWVTGKNVRRKESASLGTQVFEHMFSRADTVEHVEHDDATENSHMMHCGKLFSPDSCANIGSPRFECRISLVTLKRLAQSANDSLSRCLQLKKAWQESGTTETQALESSLSNTCFCIASNDAIGSFQIWDSILVRNVVRQRLHNSAHALLRSLAYSFACLR